MVEIELFEVPCPVCGELISGIGKHIALHALITHLIIAHNYGSREAFEVAWAEVMKGE